MRDIIEVSWKQLYADLPQAVRNISDEVNSKPLNNNLPARKLRYEASRDLAQGAGLFGPSEKQSIFIQQTFNQNNLILSPMVEKMLDKHMKSLTFEGNKEESGSEAK